MVPTLNEQSRCFVRAKFLDKDGNSQLPGSVDYRLDCETTGQVIQDWTRISPLSSVEILVTGAQNSIINAVNPLERKVMTIMANRLDPTQAFNEVQEWDLVNLQAL